MSLFHLIILFPFLYAVVVPFLYRKFLPKIHTGWFVLLAPLAIFAFLLSYMPLVSSGKTIQMTAPWIPAYDINFTAYIDGLSLLFGLIITGIGVLVVLYSIYYMSKKREALHNFYIYLLLFMGAMLGLVFSDNIFTLYVFWEITSISSFLLIAYWFQRDKSRYGALKSMLITIFGGLSMLAGLILLSIITDTYSIQVMMSKADIIQTHPLLVPAIVLILLGAFTKSAQFPFSIWLPDAMEAPTPVSAYLHSATMVKAGIYLVARFTPAFGGIPEWFWFVSIIGLFTLLYGSFNAVKQTDLKALLAFSTVSQLGLIMSLLGLGSAALYFDIGPSGTVYTIAVFAALFHLMNHSTFKGCLFMVVGIIDLQTGTRDIRRLGGLMHLMPISFTLAVIGSFAMAGLPPFNGFLSKELFFTATLKASDMSFFHMDSFGTIVPVVAWIASVFTFIYCMIIIFKTFTGKQKFNQADKQIREAPFGMLISPLILAATVVVIFLFPNYFSQYLLQPAWAAVLPTFAQRDLLDINISAWHGFNTELFMTIGIVAVGTLMYKYLKKWYGIYRFYPKALTLNHLYALALEKTEALSLSITKGYMTGFVRDYLVYIFTFIIVIIGGALYLLGDLSMDTGNDALVNAYEFALIIGTVILAALVLVARSRLTAIIAVGALGFLVVFFFVIFRAPDLALTQLVVETITTVLFLLCFYHLPKLKKENSPIQFKAANALVSLGVGIVITIVALSANGNRLFESISSYYEDAYELAGAKNIVNAILVDFRGFDTMLEILVLTMAGLGVYALVKLRLTGSEKSEGAE
ncbi:Na+/H+ antiporter subunit A [Desulfofalx alkaliphila]|uniref:Na+/H+ antiporter subunit A n=1 Tax=Desulfofalx alkaliphila TaxID=105483 RepID=UPI0004E26685|nr:Na+/H+ antiporter subunit A [Desulfofalx alkaliphila]